MTSGDLELGARDVSVQFEGLKALSKVTLTVPRRRITGLMLKAALHTLLSQSLPWIALAAADHAVNSRRGAICPWRTRMRAAIFGDRKSVV